MIKTRQKRWIYLLSFIQALIKTNATFERIPDFYHVVNAKYNGIKKVGQLAHNVDEASPVA